MLNEFINYLDNNIKNNYTDEINFNGNINNYLLNKYRKKEINVINAEYLGIKDINNKIIKLEDLFNNKEIEFNKNAFGMYIPNNELLKRNNFNWFCYLQKNEILDSEIFLAKLLILNK